MTGFAGRIFLEGDADEAKSLLGDAIKLADTLRAWKTTQRINNVTKAFNLRDGSYCVVVDLQNMRALQVVTPTNPVARLVVTEVQDYRRDEVGVMDVMCGVVTGYGLTTATIQQTNANGDTIDVETDVITGFTPTQKTSTRYSSIDARRRLAVEEDQMYRPLNTPPEIKYSVHAHVKPSCFSGAMRKVAQLLLGVGRPIRPMWEQKWRAQNNKAPLKAKLVSPTTQQQKRVTSPFGLYYATPALAGRDRYEMPFKFDYRFAKTHGISFDLDNKPWLIEISTRGVLAMPLYLDPVSTTTEGRARYLQTSPELEEFFDEFGGLPLGITFPSSQTYQKWKKAGEIVELLSAAEMSAFYSNSAFGTDVGWSFNSLGTEAHNCCAGYLNGLSTGNHYKVKIRIEREVFPASSPSKTTLLGYVAPKELYEVNKIRRMSESQAADLVRTYERDATAGRTAFDNLTVTPTLTGQAELSLVRSGILYHPARPRGQPQIKFPDSLMGGLVSFDFGPYIVGARADRCDAPMFVCHIDDVPEVVNYFADFRPRTSPPGENTREECQFTGTWTATTYGGEPYIAGHFYSSRWDWRLEITPDDTVTTYTGRKSGVQGYVFAYDFFSICLGVGSTTYFTIKYQTVGKQGKGRRISVAVPFNTRDCYYMAQHSYITSSYTYKGQFNEGTPGPQSQLWKLYNFVFHWVGRCGGVSNINAGSIRCIAKKFGEWEGPSCVADKIPLEIEYSVCPANWDGRPVNGPLTVYAPYWDNAILGSANFPPGFTIPSPWSETVQTNVGTQEYEIKMISDTGMGEIIAEKEKIVGKDPVTGDPVDFWSLPMSNWWWSFSPDPDTGAMPWMGVTHSCLGNTIINYHTDIDGMMTKSQGQPSNMHAGTSSCYVGVIE